MARVAMAFRLTEEAHRLVETMAEENGLSKTSIVEIAIREKAKRDKIKVKQGKEHVDDGSG